MLLREVTVPDSVSGVAFSPDGQTLAAANGSRISLLLVSTGETIGNLTGHTLDVQSVAFSPDGQRVVSASLDDTVRLWDVATFQEVAQIKTGKPWTAVSSPSGKTIAMAGSSPTLWDVGVPNVSVPLPFGMAQPFSVGFSPDGQSLVSAGMGEFRVWLWSVRDGLELLGEHGLWIWWVVFSPDGKTIASAGADHEIKLWDVATRTMRVKLEGFGAERYSVCFSPDGRTIASGGGDDVKVWEVATGKETRTIENGGRVWCASYQPGGEILATAKDQTIKLWNMNEPQ
ncbi:MAG: WD40 repeat domain-containing protein [Planctomycetota bacterium]|nr:WD40 repeat domain-containing protein [Planctomycetota bacterium]